MIKWQGKLGKSSLWYEFGCEEKVEFVNLVLQEEIISSAPDIYLDDYLGAHPSWPCQIVVDSCALRLSITEIICKMFSSLMFFEEKGAISWQKWWRYNKCVAFSVAIFSYVTRNGIFVEHSFFRALHRTHSLTDLQWDEEYDCIATKLDLFIYWIL